MGPPPYDCQLCEKKVNTSHLCSAAQQLYLIQQNGLPPQDDQAEPAAAEAQATFF